MSVVAGTHNLTHIDSGYVAIEHIRPHTMSFHRKCQCHMKRGKESLKESMACTVVLVVGCHLNIHGFSLLKEVQKEIIKKI